MKWMRERDLLIAQTMAFVQSVTGKAPDAERSVTISSATSAVETSEAGAAAEPLSKIAALLAKSTPAPPAPEIAASPAPSPTAVDIPRENSRPTPIPRPDLRSDFQSEIMARVANFRAHQERFTRERQAYCAATMAKVHASLREGDPPARTGK
jgi:hypothetical protein